MRRAALTPIVAGLLGISGWIASWMLIEQTGEGTRNVGGLSEGNLRAIQNPATILLLIALSTTSQRCRLVAVGKAGVVITTLALGVVLAGNVVEFGLWGQGPLDSQDPGAALFFTGLLVLAVGVLVLAAAALTAVLRRSAINPAGSELESSDEPPLHTRKARHG